MMGINLNSLLGGFAIIGRAYGSFSGFLPANPIVEASYPIDDMYCCKEAAGPSDKEWEEFVKSGRTTKQIIRDMRRDARKSQRDYHKRLNK